MAPVGPSSWGLGTYTTHHQPHQTTQVPFVKDPSTPTFPTCTECSDKSPQAQWCIPPRRAMPRAPDADTGHRFDWRRCAVHLCWWHLGTWTLWPWTLEAPTSSTAQRSGLTAQTSDMCSFLLSPRVESLKGRLDCPGTRHQALTRLAVQGRARPATAEDAKTSRLVLTQ